MSDPQQPAPAVNPPSLAPPYPPQYGQQPYPQQPWAPVALPPTMPGTVRAATIVTYVTIAITIAMTFVALVLAVLLGSIFIGTFGGSGTRGLVVMVLFAAAVVVSSSVIACWLAWETGRRKGWARYSLAACSVLSIVLSIAAFTLASVVTLAGAGTVLVLLFVPATNEWFRPAPPTS